MDPWVCNIDHPHLDSISGEATPEGEDPLVSDHLPETVQNSSKVHISAP